MRIAMRQGRRVAFDEESAAIYDVVAPTHDAAHFDALLQSLAAVLPGSGPVPARYEAFRAGFVIPPAKVDAVFRAAIDACRSADARACRTAARRAIHTRVRHGQAVERVQLVPGRVIAA